MNGTADSSHYPGISSFWGAEPTGLRRTAGPGRLLLSSRLLTHLCHCPVAARARRARGPSKEIS